MELFTTGYDYIVTNNKYVVFRGTEKECREYMKEHENDVVDDK